MAYIVPTEDFHGSEYVGDYFKTREYLYTNRHVTALLLSFRSTFRIFASMGQANMLACSFDPYVHGRVMQDHARVLGAGGEYRRTYP